MTESPHIPNQRPKTGNQPPDSENHTPESLGDQVRHAVIWRSGSQILAQLVMWASTFLVIRILSPADYGLFAMTKVVLVLPAMPDGYGLPSGLIQQREVTERKIRSLGMASGRERVCQSVWISVFA